LGHWSGSTTVNQKKIGMVHDKILLDDNESRDNFDFVSQLEHYPDLTVTQYHAMSRWSENAIRQNLDFLYDTTLFEEEIQSTARKLHVPVSSLMSFIQHEHVFHIKKSSRNVYSRLSYHVQQFVNGDESIISIAKSLRYSPYLMARKILEELYPSFSRSLTTKVMRDPNGNSLEPHLVEQITHVLEKDPMYGPDHDSRRHNIGIEYERKLETLLTIIGTWSQYVPKFNLYLPLPHYHDESSFFISVFHTH
jgi:hypothetical protein